MSALHQTQTNTVRLMRVAVALALFAALNYVLIRLGMLVVSPVRF